ncbi:MAG: hypothetical protein HJJLKODD_00235 [Phycisphaerae bacterium]|nr:hypothetical protein [Phycisphaerae bacterium]
MVCLNFGSNFTSTRKWEVLVSFEPDYWNRFQIKNTGIAQAKARGSLNSETGSIQVDQNRSLTVAARPINTSTGKVCSIMLLLFYGLAGPDFPPNF